MHQRRAKLERARNAIRDFDGDGTASSRSRSGSGARDGRLFGWPQQSPVGLVPTVTSDADLDPDAPPDAQPDARSDARPRLIAESSSYDAELDPDFRMPSCSSWPRSPHFSAFPTATGFETGSRYTETEEREMKLARARSSTRRASQGLARPDTARSNEPAADMPASMSSMDLFMASADDGGDPDLRPVDDHPFGEDAPPNDAGFFESDDDDDANAVRTEAARGQTCGSSPGDVGLHPSSPVRPRYVSSPLLSSDHPRYASPRGTLPPGLKNATSD